MNDAHLHLLFNHLPVAGAVFGFLVLLSGTLLKNLSVQRTGLLLLVLTALLTVPAFLTGEGAEEMTEHLPGVSHDAIEHHEEEGESFLWTSVVLGVLALLAFLMDVLRGKRGLLFILPVLALNVFVLIKGAETNYSGGEVRHPEIKEGFAAPEGAEGGMESNEEEEEHDHSSHEH